jgi:2'-5' RNA ligase
MHTSNKYYVALLPDEALSQLIADYKNLAYEKFGCSAANKSPAHITLIPPYSYNDNQIDSLKLLIKLNYPKRSLFTKIILFKYIENKWDIIYFSKLGD